MGNYYWMINKHKKAFREWRRGIKEGERLGALPQLARLHFEIGKCLLEAKEKPMKLANLRGEDYLEKAKELFKRMKMDSCLEEIDRIVEMGTF
jgi:hypothetical protein